MSQSGTYLHDIRPPATRSRPAHVVHDNLDDRREIYHLLARLSPRQRLAVLEEACRHAVLPNSEVHPFVNRSTRQLARQARWDSAADERLTLEIYYDLWHLDISFQVDFEALLKRLVQRVRRS